jgi:hypothetical protein
LSVSSAGIINCLSEKRNPIIKGSEFVEKFKKTRKIQGKKKKEKRKKTINVEHVVSH